MEMLSSESVPSEARLTLLANEQDVWNLYDLILKRDPENRHAITGNIGNTIAAIFFAMLRSEEFHEKVLPSVVSKTIGDVPYHGTQTITQLLNWAAARLPLGERAVAALGGARTWDDYVEIVLKDRYILDQVPDIRIAGISTSPETGPRNSAVSGDVEVATIWEVRGWCRNATASGEVVEVEIFADDQSIGTARCEEFRRDIQEKLGGDGHCGFTFAMPGEAQSIFLVERRVIVYEKSTRTAIGPLVLLRNDLRRGGDGLARIERDAQLLREKLAQVEHQLASYRGTVAYPLYAYGEYADRFGRAVPEDLAEESGAVAHFANRPLISIILTVAQVSEAFSASIRSLAVQIYSAWEAIIVAAPGIEEQTLLPALLPLGDAPLARLIRAPASSDPHTAWAPALALCKGEYVLFLRDGDMLEPDALYQIVARLQKTAFKALYADEDSYARSSDGKTRHHSPRFKPDFDPDYFLADDYLGRFVLYDRSLLEGEASSPRALALNALSKVSDEQIAHVPLVLFHAAASLPNLSDVAVVAETDPAVGAYIAAKAWPATVAPHEDTFGLPRKGAARVQWTLPAEAPSVTLIIPTKDRAELIGPCLASVLATTAQYPGTLEILVLDNNTTQPAARALLRTLSKSGSIRLLDYVGAFNWSAMNNFAAAQATGEVVVFLNNDTLAVATGWLEELVSQALRPDVGAVGCRLLYEDDTIQHGGIVNIGGAGLNLHEGMGEPARDGGYLGRTQLQHRAVAVTGACMATRKAVFEQVGGFDEGLFAVIFNDTDYCFKLRAHGLGIVYTPFATLYHYESKSRGIGFNADANSQQLEAYEGFRQKWGERATFDPYYNPHFERAARPFRYLRAGR